MRRNLLGYYPPMTFMPSIDGKSMDFQRDSVQVFDLISTRGRHRCLNTSGLFTCLNKSMVTHLIKTNSKVNKERILLRIFEKKILIYRIFKMIL